MKYSALNCLVCEKSLEAAPLPPPNRLQPGRPQPTLPIPLLGVVANVIGSSFSEAFPTEMPNERLRVQICDPCLVLRGQNGFVIDVVATAQPAYQSVGLWQPPRNYVWTKTNVNGTQP